jgi:GR25 family glycosyltransferase involved in LPS biosynthesis
MQSPQKTKIYILGLKNNFRGVNLFESIKKENLDVEVIWGVDYRLHKFSKDQFPDVKEEIFYGRQVSFGELACNLGHAMIMQKAFEEDIDLAVILEDDVHILNFLEFKTVIANLDMLNPALVSLYFNERNILSLSKKRKIISEKFYLKRNYCLSASTAAYAINKTALRRINPFLGSRKHISFQPDFPPYMGGLLTFFLLENSFINLAEDSLSVVNDRKNLFRKDGMAKRRVSVYSGVFFITYAHKLMNLKGYLMFFHGRKLSRMLKPQKRN